LFSGFDGELVAVHGPDGDNWSLDQLFRGYGDQAISFVSEKFQIDRRRWRTGDVPPRPLSLGELAEKTRIRPERLHAFDTDLISRLESHPGLARADLRFFRWPIENAKNEWERAWGRTHDGMGRLKRKL